MLTKQELENIKPGDRITYSDYNLSTSAYEDVEGTVVETRVRCGKQGDVMEDYLILDDGTEVDYTNVSRVIGHKQNNERAIKSTIGRFKLTEVHEDTLTYSMADEEDIPFVLTQFIVELSDGTYTTPERQEITFYPKSDVEVSNIPFEGTEEEEVKQMIKDYRGE